MAKQKITTKTTKRYRYSSFKAKIDDLKIEPARNLTKRAHDYVETSHLLASFDHWKEINLSAGFSAFADENENIIQTLPQILYHQDKILNNLVEHIDEHDDKSLQPLLDLLAQFCHDLGPDFMKFYEKAVTSLIKLLDDAVKFENTNVFEWGFNCLAYIFKYLSRLLSTDLIPTFTLLFPLLSHSKEYLSRFSAEAMSFLIRKSTSKNLESFVSYSFKKLVSLEESRLYDGLTILFTESLTSTQEALHSKSKAIITTLIESALASVNLEVCTSLICDVWMNISKHTSSENISSLYEAVLEVLQVKAIDSNLDSVTRILSTLAFAESGRKISDWSQVTAVVEKLMTIEDRSTLNSKSCAFLFSTLIRNCDIKSMTVYHKKIFEFYLSEFPENFIEFFICALELSSENVYTFNGIKYFQKFINTNWKNYAKKIALFILELEEKPTLSNKLNIHLPDEFVQSLLVSIGELSAETDLYEIYWRLILLRSSNVDCYKVILPILNRTILGSDEIDDFTKDVIGSALQILSKFDKDETHKLLDNILAKLDIYKESVYFVNGLRVFVESMDEDEALTELFESHSNHIEDLTTNLVLPDSKLRYETLKLFSSIWTIQGKETPRLLNECKIIEEIPLTLQNARDITVRIRSMGEDYRSNSSDVFVTKMFFRYLFGLLTIRFSPVWEGVYEILPTLYSSDQALVWDLIMQILVAPDNEYIVKYHEGPMQDDIDLDFWKVGVSRLNDILSNMSRVWSKFIFQDASIIDMSKLRRGNLVYPGQIRSQALKVMSLFPSLAERHSKDIVPFLFNEAELEDMGDERIEELDSYMTATKWSDLDRNALLKVVAKFKNIKSIYKADEVYDRFMLLLGSGNTDVQKLALDGVFAYKNPVTVKYRNNLKNLLDDTLFRDEITKLLANDEAKMIEDNDEEQLMKYALRIFFGRAQTANASGVKKSRKNAVISSLPTLKQRYIVDFFRLGSGRFNSQYYFENGNSLNESEISVSSIKRMTGFVNIVNLSLSVLGSNFPIVIGTVVNPLLYTIAASNFTSPLLSEDVVMIKASTHLRQQAMKCLNSIFQYMGETLNWDSYIQDIFNIVIQPRLLKFEDENLQQPSSIMKVMTYWATDVHLYPFLYYSNFATAKALMSTVTNSNAKESVVAIILEAANNIVKSPSDSDAYVELVTLIASTCLRILPVLYKKLTDVESVSTAVDLLLNMTEAGYVQDNETRKYLVDSLTQIMDTNMKNINNKDTLKILKVISVLMENYDCAWEDIEKLYKVISSFYRLFTERDLREALNEVFVKIGSRFENIKRVAKLLVDLNAYSQRRIHEYDFPTRLTAFREFTEKDYILYSEIEWLPVIYTSLYFLNDRDELALRNNATHTITKFIDFINEKHSVEEANKAITMLRSVILPYIRTGLRRFDEEIQGEYIAILAYIVKNSKYYNELEDMQVLLYNNDEEANFFTNINNIQLHRRQRAIKRLGEHGKDLSEGSISHYLIPIIEHYVFSEEEKYRNLGNESLLSIGILSNFMSWNQYKALIRRYISMMKNKPDHLREVVSLITNISVTMKNTLQSLRGVVETDMVLRKVPSNISELDTFVTEEVYPVLSKILGTRNDETIVNRTPLAEALVNLVLGLEHDTTTSLLPGILTNICQVLRSKSEELRDAIRKTLSKISVILGPEYLTFIIKELTSALQRGSQVHVLSYTVHHVLKALEEVLKHSDLDGCAHMIVRVIMEDVFGTAGQEKDSDNYHSKVKEVKVNRSYDTGEVLSANISLSIFGTLLMPVKAMLMERMNLKSQNKLEELLRRYALGLNHNDDAGSTDVLKLCHEIFDQSQNGSKKKKRAERVVDEKEEFFLVNLNAKGSRVQIESSLFTDTLQKFSLDLLRTVLSRHSNLLEVAYLEGFVPLLKESLLSDNEGVLVSTLRVLILMVKLEFSEESEPVFKNCARKVLNIIKDSPSTSTELCQHGLKFLSSFIRHKDIKLKDTALSYVLGRILPDLNEPSKQGLAFNFLKALVSKHIMLSELYEVIDSVREIVVTNHSKEIRDVSRSVYYQFLMEYDQSKGRLERQFKFMVDNLQYPSQEGRQSIMELINLIVTKANAPLLAKLSSSFFVSLANVSFNDDAPKCREMASVLLANLLKKLEPSSLDTIEKYITAWLKQAADQSFLNLGLRIYKIYLSSVGLGNNKDLDDLAISRVKSIISDTDVGSEMQWDVIYTSLSLFSVYVEKSSSVYQSEFKSTWSKIIACLLYPHSWVRLASARLVGDLVVNLDKFDEKFSDYEIQTVVSRTLHQLSAPSISESISSTAIKTLVKIGMLWKEANTEYIPEPKSKTDDLRTVKYNNSLDYMICRASAIIRSEENPTESFISKKSCIQLLAMLIQIMDDAQLQVESEKIILPLFVFTEGDHHYRMTEEQQELSTISQECLQMLESKLSVADFTKAYANVKQIVWQRRQERRAKRSILAVSAPDIAANRKLKKHARTREKRKHERDDNGYYQRKNKQRKS